MRKKDNIQMVLPEKQEIYNRLYEEITQNYGIIEQSAIASKGAIMKFLQSGTIDLQVVNLHMLKLSVNLKQLETLKQLHNNINVIFHDYKVEIEKEII